MSTKKLRRYTNISALIYLLKNRVITLIDPRSWPDTNDSYGLSIYKKRKSLKTLLALCFAQAPEKYHHWHVFAQGTSGVSIVFNTDEFINHISQNTVIKHKDVEYLMLKDYKHNIKQYDVDSLPFIKRYGFKDEGEYRLIYEDKMEAIDTKDVSIPLSCINHIALNPWIPNSLFETTREVLRSIDCVSNITIEKSSLLDNKKWKEVATRIK